MSSFAKQCAAFAIITVVVLRPPPPPRRRRSVAFLAQFNAACLALSVLLLASQHSQVDRSQLLQATAPVNIASCLGKFCSEIFKNCVKVS